MQEKEAIRKEMRAKRRAVTPDQREAASRLLTERLLQNPHIKSAACVAVYMASVQELDLAALIAELLRRGIQIAAPRWNGTDYDLAVLESLETSALREGPMHILEPQATARQIAPSQVDVWLIPGLAFTHAGSRLGYGGGWYDRLLANAAPAAHRIGVGYDFQVLEALPTEMHDCSLTEIVAVALK